MSDASFCRVLIKYSLTDCFIFSSLVYPEEDDESPLKGLFKAVRCRDSPIDLRNSNSGSFYRMSLIFYSILISLDVRVL
jgi:hypothetical protein